jgi:hypothetical protein
MTRKIPFAITAWTDSQLSIEASLMISFASKTPQFLSAASAGKHLLDAVQEMLGRQEQTHLVRGSRFDLKQ